MGLPIKFQKIVQNNLLPGSKVMFSNWLLCAIYSPNPTLLSYKTKKSSLNQQMFGIFC